MAALVPTSRNGGTEDFRSFLSRVSDVSRGIRMGIDRGIPPFRRLLMEAILHRRSSSVVMTTVRNMDLVVEKTEVQYLAHPDRWDVEMYDIILLSRDGVVRRYDYPQWGLRGSRFRYKVNDFVQRESQDNRPALALTAAYTRFKLMIRMIQAGGKPFND